MKTIKTITVLLVLLITLSCSSGSEEIENETNTFEGLWVLRDFSDTTNVDNDVLPLIAEFNAFIELVVDEGCETMSFEFKENQSLIIELYDFDDFNDSEDSVEYTADCENVETITDGTWKSNENQLIITSAEGESSSFSYILESDNKMILKDVPLTFLFPVDGEVNMTFVKMQ